MDSISAFSVVSPSPAATHDGHGKFVIGACASTTTSGAKMVGNFPLEGTP